MLTRRGLFQIFGAALAAREVPRLVPPKRICFMGPKFGCVPGRHHPVCELSRALQGGNYSTAPSYLTQGAALRVEDLSMVMDKVTFRDTRIQLRRRNLPDIDEGFPAHFKIS